MPGRGRRKGRGRVCVAGNRPLHGLSKLFRASWLAARRPNCGRLRSRAMKWPDGGLSGGLAALRGRAFFIFQFAPGAKGLGFVGGFLWQRKTVRVGDWPRGEFRLLRQATRGLCPRPPRFFEKNRVKLFFARAAVCKAINFYCVDKSSGSAHRRSRRAKLC